MHRTLICQDISNNGRLGCVLYGSFDAERSFLQDASVRNSQLYELWVANAFCLLRRTYPCLQCGISGKFSCLSLLQGRRCNRLNGVISFLFSIPFALFRAKRARQRVTGSQQLSNNCNCNCGCICKQNACNIPTNPLDLGTKLLFLFNLVSGQNCCPVRVYATTVPLFGSEFDFSSYFWPCKAYRKAE